MLELCLAIVLLSHVNCLLYGGCFISICSHRFQCMYICIYILLLICSDRGGELCFKLRVNVILIESAWKIMET